eukprot:CCRYP_012861-RA/>CCRYP_012861-RA protein AED:0.23 eAED:0.75 QI:0/0/0/1/1/1/2/0/279
MSAEKIAPIGLKNQECERGRGGEKAPIRYVPDRDPVQEALDLKPETLKCTLANGSETRVTVWSGHGTNEQFVLHVNKAYSTAKKMGLIPPAMMPKRHMSRQRRKFEILYFKLPQEAQQGSVRQFVQRVMQLNNYVEDLPCLYYSPSASTMTQQVYSFTDAELSCHILRMCPLKWQDQYHLLEKCYPEGVKPLLLILERIEVAHPVDERQSSSKPAKAQGAEQPSKKFALGARIPKKPKQARTEYTRVDKNCELCKKHGGARTTHNTAEFRRYNKDGTPT